MHFDQFLLALLILLAVSTLSVALFTRLGLGSILGLLATGVVIGPSGLGLARRVHELRELSELGVVFLLFLIGLEMQPQRLWSLRRIVFGLGTAQVMVSGLALALYGVLIGNTWSQALILGFGLALSSTALVVQLLEERSERDTDHGRTVFGILLFQDLSIVPLLALVPVLSGSAAGSARGSLLYRAGLVGAALAAVYLLGRFVVPAILDRFVRTRNGEAFALAAVAAVIAAAWLMLRVGLSMALGSFVMGVLLSGSLYRDRIEAVVEPFKSLLLGLFFIAVGMSIDIGLLPEAGATLAVHLIAVLAIKVGILFGIGLAFHVRPAVALRVALFLPQCGEFGFVLFAAANAAGLLRPDSFEYAALLISMSMVVTPLFAKLADIVGRRDRGAALAGA